MKSVQTKFIALILGCVLMACFVIGGAGMLNAKSVVDEDAAKIMNMLCNEQASELDALLQRIEQSVKTLAVYALGQLDSVERFKRDDGYVAQYTKRLEEVAVNAAENTEGAVAVYVRFNPAFSEPTSGLFWSRTSLSGRFEQLTPTDFSCFSPTDVQRVGWYYIPVERGKATWMDPYMNQNINLLMISYVIPLFMNNEVIGVVGMDIDFDVIGKVVSSTHIYDSGYAFLADEAGLLLYHGEYPLGTPMESTDVSLIPLVNALENGSSDNSLFVYRWKGQEKKSAFRSLENGMRLVVAAPVDEVDAVKNRLLLHISILVVLISTISVLMTVLMTRRIIYPLKELTVAAKKIAAGDLSIVLTCKTKDEVGTLTESFQHTVDHLKKYIDYINGLAYRDPLTGVKNKGAYLNTAKRLEEQIRHGKPEFGVVVLDLNGLKQVNDQYGHDFGDLLIIEAAKLICKSFQHSPVYRIGGDEFVVILENTDYLRYSEVLDGFEASINDYNKNARPDSRVSIARGIAIYNDQIDIVFHDVFKRADEAMYKNKAAMKSGENAKE